MSDAAVWISPARMSGQPCLYGTRIPTDIVAEAYWKYGMEECKANWLLEPHQVVDAIWYESKYGSRKMRKRYALWAEKNMMSLWGPNTYGPPNDPPTEADLVAKESTP